MSYESGTYTDIADLLAKIRIFAVANGWTANETAASWTNLEKSGQFVNLRAVDAVYTTDVPGPFIAMRGATGYDSLEGYGTQPGTSREVVSNDLTSGGAYHLFSDGDYVHVAAEPRVGVFSHVGFGAVDKVGTYTGGAYLFGLRWNHAHVAATTTNNRINDPFNNHHAVPFDCGNSLLSQNNDGHSHVLRAEVDAKTGSDGWFFFGNNSTATAAQRRGLGVWRGSSALSFNAPSLGILQTPFELTPSAYNQVGFLFPVPAMVQRPDSFYSPVGWYPDVRLVNMTNIQPGQVLSIAGDDWMCFPLKRKTGQRGISTSSDLNSWVFGLAYKRVTV